MGDVMTDTQNKFFSRDRQKAFDEIKEMIYARMEVCEISMQMNTDYNTWNVGYDSATENEVAFLRQVIDMMERS